MKEESCMKNVYKLEFHAGSKEELLPDFESDRLLAYVRMTLDISI